jgi:hypothetical protein
MRATTINPNATFRETAIIITLHDDSGLGFQLHSYPVFVEALFQEQYVGVRLRRKLMAQWEGCTSGCLVMDVWRNRSRG